MLEELEIHHLGPIREAVLRPSPGMTAITGETGAGKSMLLNAIRLISGGSADSGRVSPDAVETWTQGIFVVNEASVAASLARDAGVDTASDDDELFLSRTVPVSGRSRAVLSGHSVPRSVLADITQELVTIHGQTDQLRIASAVRQREFLDMVAGDDKELDAYSLAFHALQDIDQRLEHLNNQEASVRQRADYLRESIEEINDVDPQPGEDDELKAKRSRIENAAEIMQGVNAALAALDATQVDVDSDAVGALELLNRAEQSLRSIRVDGIFAEASERLQSISTDLSDVIFTLSQEIEQQEHVEDLDSLNARIHALGELTRRWGPGLADVIAWRDKAELDVQDLDASPEKVQELEEERDRLLGVAVAAAQRLSSARKAAAKSLSVTVSDELSSLAMSGARLDIEVRERHGSSNELAGLDSHGHDDIEFLFTPFPGSPKLSMGKSASGGELSRLMLSLELAAAGAHTERDSAAGSGMTFIFDEVDAGVGGKAAVQLGRRLASLARHAQVLVVTHLPQVASWADAQFVVSKGDADAAGSGDSADSADSTESGPSVVTCVNEVTGEPRVHEIARMLSGSESQASLEHARELLASSRL